MASVNAERVKCACLCIVSLGKAVTRDGRAYCCDACADGHKDHEGCERAGCPCHG